MSQDITTDLSSPIVATPVGDPKREATAARRGYLYQDVRAALAWMDLEQDQVLFLEVAEDYSIARSDSLSAVQVKDVGKNLTLLSEGVCQAIKSFIDLRAKNAPKDVRLVFWTTAEAGIEKDTSHRAGEEGSIAYWIKASACPDVDVLPLKKALLRIGNSGEVREFLESRSPSQIRSDLIEKISWWIGRESFEDLRERLIDRVTLALQARNLTRIEASSRWAQVLEEVQNISLKTNAGDRQLTRQRLDSLLDELSSAIIPMAQFRELQEKAAIANVFPVEKTSADLDHQLRHLRLWRRFVACNAGARARSIACEVRSGAYQVLDASIKADAMAMAARVLLDEDREFANQLMEEAVRSAPSRESVVVARAIFEGRTDISAGMNRLQRLDTNGANDARYFIQREDGSSVGRALKWYRDAGLVANDLSDYGNAVVLMDLMRSGHWEDAFKLVSVLDDGPREPFLTFQLALATICRVSPVVCRSEVMISIPIFNPVDFCFDDSWRGIENRRRAVQLLDRLKTEALTANLPKVAAYVNEYVLWLRLSLNKLDQQARGELEDLVNRTGADRFQWIPLALSAGCRFDKKQARAAIDQNFHRTGLDDVYRAKALLALLMADSQPISPDEWNVLRPRLDRYISADFLRFVEVSLQAHSGDFAVAEAVLNEIEDSRLRDRIAVSMKSRASGGALAAAREMFSRTNDVQDLEHLVQMLGEAKQWDEMSDHASDLFGRTKAAIHAEWMLDSLARSHQWQAVAEFFHEYTETGRGNVKIERLRAICFANQSRWNDLSAQLERLAQVHPAAEMGIRIDSMLLSFRWDQFGPLIDHALVDFGRWTAGSLLRLAKLARLLGREEDSRSLIRGAVQASNGDPDVQFAAYLAATRAGWENSDEVGAWLQSAVARSESSATIKRLSLEDVAEQMPVRRQHHQSSWDLARTGQIWLSAHAGLVNSTPGEQMLGAAIRNLRQQDPRKRSIILAFSGARPPVKLTAKRVAADLSSLLTLSLLDLLEKLPLVFEKVLIPHDTGWWLAKELETITYHQPSRIICAEERLKLLGSGKISVCDVMSADRRSVENLGLELAELVAGAEKVQQSGSPAYVIRTAPIHIPGTYGAGNLNPADVPKCIRSLVCLFRSLREQRYLALNEFERAEVRLLNVDCGWGDERLIERSATLFLDDLTVAYLQDFSLMDVVLKSKHKLVVHSSLRRDAELYDDERRVGEEMFAKLSTLRRFLEKGVRSGFVEVLPKPIARWGKSPEISSTSTDLVEIQGEHDGVLVDDRFFNVYPGISEKSVETLTTLDVLDRLVGAGEIDREDWFEHRTTLRRCGYALLPVTEEEMSRALTESQIDGNSLLESVPFRAIGENTCLVQMREVLLLAKEAAWLESLTCSVRRVLGVALDGYESVFPALALMDLANIELFGNALNREIDFHALDLVAKVDYLSICLTCFAEKPSPAFKSGSSELFGRLLVQRPRIHQEIAEEVKKRFIKLSNDLRCAVRLSEHDIRSHWYRFISDLPDSVENLFWSDEALMEELGFSTRSRVELNISGSPKFERDQLWQAVIFAQAAGLAEVVDLANKVWKLRRDEAGQILLSDDGQERSLAFDQELAHSSPETRWQHFAARCAGYGIDHGFPEIERTLRARPLTIQEISAFQDALRRHPISKEREIRKAICNEEVALSDAFPAEWEYYELLVGKWDNESNVFDFSAKHPQEGVGNFASDPEGNQRAIALRRALLNAGHSSTSPRELVAESRLGDLEQFLDDHLSTLDLWSLAALIEALLAHPDWRSISHKLVVASRIVLASIMDPMRIKLSWVIFEVADLRLRDLAGSREVPPYWRRMAAISHAQIVERAVLASGIDISRFSEWLSGHVFRAFWATIPDMNREPRWGPVMMSEQQLGLEMVSRNYAAWRAALSDIEPTEEEEGLMDQYGRMIDPRLFFPGPAEGVEGGHACYDELAEKVLSDLEESPLKLNGWSAASIAGLAFRLPLDLVAKLRSGVDQATPQDFSELNSRQVEGLLIQLASLAAGQRDESLATSVAQLSQRLWIDAKSINAQVCLAVCSIAAAASAARIDWQNRLVKGANLVAFRCSEKADAKDCLAALETMAWSDWRLRVPLARARVALRSLARML